MARSICTRCKRPQRVCFCHLLSSLENRWPVTLVQHIEESKHAIGTAKIAQLSLKNCVTHILNDNDKFTSTDYLANSNNNSASGILIYPGENSINIEELEALPPLPLIFIDASWRKSRKIFYNSPFLQSLPSCSFSLSQPSRYKIRKEPKPNYCSTLEAIVYMLAELEHEPEKYSNLLSTMDWMIDQQIKLMGEKNFRTNY